MSILLSLHTYWMLNAAITFSYIFSILIIKIPYFNSKVSQLAQLTLLRQILTTSLVVFILADPIASTIKTNTTNSFQWQPIIRQASNQFLRTHGSIQKSLTTLKAVSSTDNATHTLLFSVILLFIYLMGKYIFDISKLISITDAAQPYRKIKSTHILFSNVTTTPFCWSSLTSHYIILPSTLLLNTIDMRLAIKHELQHVRQGDTYWIQIMSLLNIICFWNPFIHAICKHMSEQQEYACDESLIINSNTSKVNYAQCLISSSAADNHTLLPRTALGIINFNKRYHLLLKRRINMIFDYKKKVTNKKALAIIYATCFFSASTFAFALETSNINQPLSAREMSKLVAKSHLDIAIMPEVITEINNIRGSEQAREYMQHSLSRMQEYKPYIVKQLKEHNMPTNLLALPLVESGFNPKTTSAMNATGIWQFIPSTAKHYGLTVNSTQDDRLNTELETQAAIQYLTTLHTQFHDWRLAVMAYEIGEVNLQMLIDKVGTNEPWVLARSPAAPADLKKYLTMYDAGVIIINNPQLIQQS